MLNTVRAVVKEEQIHLLDKVESPEGAEVREVPLGDDSAFWLGVSQSALDKIWDNEDDDIYAELLK